MRSTQARPQKGGARLVVRWGLMGCCLLRGKIDKTFGAAVSKSTGYSQTRGPKIIWREKVATGDWSDAKAPMTPMKGLRRQMAKIGSGGVSSRREAAPQLMINRERRNNSGPFAASVVKFMELRPSMCRWPIGDPKHIETFRFCGSACSPGAIYCKPHTAKAHAPIRPRTSRTTEFQVQPPVKVA